MQPLQQLLVGGRILGHGGRQLVAASDLDGRRADRLPVEARQQARNEFGIEVDFDLLLFGDLRGRRRKLRRVMEVIFWAFCFVRLAYFQHQRITDFDALQALGCEKVVRD